MVESQNQSPLKSIIPYGADNHFPLENIPFGAFINHRAGNAKHCATRIGDYVIDLAILEQSSLF
jgi:fumarylacetoacetase